jgi:hypothetical protein
VSNRAGGGYATGGTTGSALDDATLAAGATTATSPGVTGATGSADLAARIVTPRKVSHIRTVYGFLAAAAALMFLIGMAWAGRGDQAWMAS